MAINFPSSPATGQEYTYLGKAWRYNGTGWALTNGKPYGREVLTAARTYYVATTGSDSADGLTAGTPFLTIQKAVDVACGTLDMGIYQVTIQVADGTYTSGVVARRFVGALAPVVIGNVANSSSVHISTSGSCVSASASGAALGVQRIKLSSSAGMAALATTRGELYLAHIVFGVCSVAHMYASGESLIQASTAYSISGNTTYHAIALFGATVNTTGATVTLTLNITLTYFAAAMRLGKMIAESVTYSLGGFTVTGVKYSAEVMGLIFTGTGNTNLFPGSSAGTTATSGLYI